MSFLRSKLQSDEKVAKLVEKISSLHPKKSNVFNVDFKGQRFFGEKMDDLDFSDPTKITFTYEEKDYELLLADVTIAKRIRSRKYMFKTNVLAEVVEEEEIEE
jgi:hypothetical protein